MNWQFWEIHVFYWLKVKFVDLWKNKKLPNKLILKGRAKHFQKQR